MTTSLRRARWSLLLLAVVCSSCLTVDGVLKADGSGTLEMTYIMPVGATEGGERKRHTSDHVTVESLTLSSDKKSATVKVKIDDVTKLSTAEAFKNVTVARAKDGSDERLTITITNQKTMELKEEGQPGPVFKITVPGAIKDANRDGKITDNKVTWSFSLPAFAKEKTVELTVRYAAPADAAKDAGAKDAGGKDAPAKDAGAKDAAAPK